VIRVERGQARVVIPPSLTVPPVLVVRWPQRLNAGDYNVRVAGVVLGLLDPHAEVRVSAVGFGGLVDQFIAMNEKQEPPALASVPLPVRSDSWNLRSHEGLAASRREHDQLIHDSEFQVIPDCVQGRLLIWPLAHWCRERAEYAADHLAV